MDLFALCEQQGVKEEVKAQVIVDDNGVTLEVCEQPACYNEHFEMLYKRGNVGISSDYYIPSLEVMLEHSNFVLSKILWDTISKEKNRDCSRASYKVAWYRSYRRSCDSTLIWMLKKYAWIPDKDMVLHMPCDITIKEMHPDFAYDSSNPMHSALNIGNPEVSNNFSVGY